MLFGVISDTHIPRRRKDFPRFVLDYLQKVDVILHIGDWQDLSVYKELEEIAPVIGVAGNVDSEEIVTYLGYKKMIYINEYKIGIVHGHGTGKTTEKRALEAFETEEVDCIIFGHSHIPVKKYSDNILLFNPGSPTDKRRQKMYSFGVLKVGEELTAEHIFFSGVVTQE
ncbi:metallophosphoesterase [Bacillus timonensis]|nr:metallophosphoesterase [Bacillus timonensis]